MESLIDDLLSTEVISKSKRACSKNEENPRDQLYFRHNEPQSLSGFFLSYLDTFQRISLFEIILNEINMLHAHALLMYRARLSSKQHLKPSAHPLSCLHQTWRDFTALHILSILVFASLLDMLKFSIHFY